MEKFVQLGEKFGLEGEKLLEFVREQQKLEEEREEKRREEEREERRLQEEKGEKRRQLEEEKEEKRRRLEEERRQEEEEKEERRRREDKDRETRRQERELRKLERELELMRQREAAEAAKREHELKLARLAAADNPDPSWQDHVQEEQVRAVEQEKAMKNLQDLLSEERRRLSDVRDALDKEKQLTKQLKEKLSVEKLLKSEVERELAEVSKAKESLQRELKTDKSLMCETTNQLRDGEDNTVLEDEVNEEVKSGLTTLKENCVLRERKQFTIPENEERLETLDGEINSFIIEVPAKKVRVVEATTLGAVAVGMETTNRRSDYVGDEVEEVVVNVNCLVTDGYVTKELIDDVDIGDYLTDDRSVLLKQSRGIT